MPDPFPIKARDVTGLSITATIERDSDGLFLDFADGVFKAAGHATPTTAMPEVVATLVPAGHYESAPVSAATWTDGFYTVYLAGVTVDPIELDIVSGGLRHDLLDVAISSRATSTPGGGTPPATVVSQTAGMQVGEIGFQLVLLTGRDLSDAASVAILVRKSNQVVLTPWVASVVAPATEGKIAYTTVSGDLDVPGFWRFQAEITTTGGAVLYGEAVQLRVKPLYGI